MEEKINTTFVYASEYEDYVNSKDNISPESVVIIDEKGKEKLITQRKEFNFIPSDGKDGYFLQYDKENGTKWTELVNDNAFELVNLGEGINNYATQSTKGGCSASAKLAYAEGNKTNATGESSHSEGENTEANGRYSHAEGNGTKAVGSISHAEGASTKANGDSSHAEGCYTEANGYCSHAEGEHTVAKGNYSHTEGYYTEALNYHEHAGGRYNVSHTNGTNEIDYNSPENTIHSVGVGDYKERKNAFEIMRNGDTYVLGVGGYNGVDINEAKTLQEVINGIPEEVINGIHEAPTGNYIRSIKQNGGYITYESTNFRTGDTDEYPINFKTINSQPIFGSGDIKIESGSGVEFPDGEVGQVLTKTENGVEFKNLPSNDGISLQRITRAEYNAKFDAGTLDDNTLYLITG